jgi:hypothetical protein
MLPALRFMLGAALASLLLIITMFGLAATVRLAQQAKVSPLKPARALAYASPAGRSEFEYDDRARHFGAAADSVPLSGGEWLLGAAAPKAAEQPQEHAQSDGPPNEPVTSIIPAEEGVEDTRPQEEPGEGTASITVADEDRSASASAGGEAAAEAERTAPVRSAIEPNPTAEADGTADAAEIHEPLSGGPPIGVEPEAPPSPGSTAEAQREVAAPTTASPQVEPPEDAGGVIRPNQIASAESAVRAKRAEPHGARVQRPAPKSKTAAHPVKVRKTIAKPKAPPAASAFVAGIGFPPSQNWSSAGNFATRPATKPAPSRLCGLGSAPCPRPLLQNSGSRQTNLRISPKRRP